MAYVSIYLNFMGNAEEAFNHYKKVFRTEFSAPLMRMKDMPPRDGAPALTEAEKNKVMHVALPFWVERRLWQPICWKAWDIN
jgi:PhnB protein